MCADSLKLNRLIKRPGSILERIMKKTLNYFMAWMYRVYSVYFKTFSEWLFEKQKNQINSHIFTFDDRNILIDTLVLTICLVGVQNSCTQFAYTPCFLITTPLNHTLPFIELLFIENKTIYCQQFPPMYNVNVRRPNMYNNY